MLAVNGRRLGALGDSWFGPLVPSWLAGLGEQLASCGSRFGWDRVSLLHDRTTRFFGDQGPVDVMQLVGGVVAQTGGDPGQQDGGDGAQRGGVVFPVVDHQPVVAGGEGGVGLAGVVGGHEQRLT